MQAARIWLVTWIWVASCAQELPPPPPPGVPAAGMTPTDATPAPTQPADALGDPGPLTDHRWFRDVTTEAGITMVGPQTFDNLIERMSGGVCILDADGTGPQDLFFAVQGGESRLYTAQRALDFHDSTAEAGLHRIRNAVGCLAFDAEGDGDDDLLVLQRGQVRLFIQDDEHYFDVASVFETLSIHPDDLYLSAASGDIDSDGDVDLFIGGAIRFDARRLDNPECGIECASRIELFDPLPNLLLLRNPDGTYENAAGRLAPRLLDPEPTLAVGIVDLNHDGYLDLYVANDLGHTYPNRPLLQHENGIFYDGGLLLGMTHNAQAYGMDSMGFSTADINRDGYLDHVVTSFAGDPTAVFFCAEDAFCEAQAPAQSGTISGIETVRWGVALTDFDLDGWPDLLEATGDVLSDEELMAIEEPGFRDQHPNLLRNRAGIFEGVAVPEDDGLYDRRSLRGIAITDFDEDGHPDVVFAPAVGRPLLLHNVRPTDGHWLRIQLEGPESNRDAAGTIVDVIQGPNLYRQTKRVGEGYLGNFDRRLFFGFPSAAPVNIRIRWPDGTETHQSTQAVDSALVLRWRAG